MTYAQPCSSQRQSLLAYSRACEHTGVPQQPGTLAILVGPQSPALGAPAETKMFEPQSARGRPQSLNSRILECIHEKEMGEKRRTEDIEQKGRKGKTMVDYHREYCSHNGMEGHDRYIVPVSVSCWMLVFAEPLHF